MTTQKKTEITEEIKREESKHDNSIISLDHFIQIKKLGKSKYYRLKYEIRDDPNPMKSESNWEKLLKRVTE